MSKTVKIWFIIAGALILLGIVIFIGAMCVMGWSFSKMSTDKFVENKYEISDNFKNISVNSNTADIKLLPADDGKCRVECYEEEKAKHSVLVKDGVLDISLVNEKKWYDYIQIRFDFSSPEVTVYIPKDEYENLKVSSSTSKVEVSKELCFRNIDIEVSTGYVDCYASVNESLSIKTSTGNIVVEDISVDSLELSVSTGKITASKIDCKGDLKVKVSTGKSILSEVKCKNLITTGSTGDITLIDVIAEENFDIERNTGDVKLERCDAAKILIVTDTGKVSGSLLSNKIFVTKTDTGKIEVPSSAEGGICEITTDTGDIKINIH